MCVPFLFKLAVLEDDTKFIIDDVDDDGVIVETVGFDLFFGFGPLFLPGFLVGGAVLEFIVVLEDFFCDLLNDCFRRVDGDCFVCEEICEEVCVDDGDDGDDICGDFANFFDDFGDGVCICFNGWIRVVDCDGCDGFGIMVLYLDFSIGGDDIGVLFPELLLFCSSWFISSTSEFVLFEELDFNDLVSVEVAFALAALILLFSFIWGSIISLLSELVDPVEFFFKALLWSSSELFLSFSSIKFDKSLLEDVNFNLLFFSSFIVKLL